MRLFLSFAASVCLLIAALPRTSTPQPAHAAIQACSTIDGDFENGAFGPWHVNSSGANGASATLALDAGISGAQAARVDIGTPGSASWHVQLSHNDVPVSLGRRYVLAFWARAAGARPVDILLQQQAYPYDVMWSAASTIDTGWQRHEYIIDVPYDAPSLSPALRLNLGARSESVWIDAISLCEANTQPAPPAPEPVSAECSVLNGDFELGLAQWTLQVTASAQATLRADDGARSAQAARIDTNASAQSRDVALSQTGIALPGGWTSIAFYARASNGQPLIAALENEAGDTIWERSIALPSQAEDAAFNHHFFAFESGATNNATLKFYTGARAGSVWIDAAHVCPMQAKLNEPFDGSALNSTLWQHCTAYSRDCALIDDNGTVDWHNPANVTLADGIASLRMTRHSNTVCVGCSYNAPVWTTRELAGSYIQTSQGFATTYGFVEARIRLPRTPGLWPAFWLLPTLSNEGNIIWPPEIDVLEQYTSDPHVSIHSLHYNSAQRQDEVDAGYGVFGSSLGDDYHTYAVNWTPYEIIWYVDGRETHRSSATRVTMPMYLILNLATGGIAGTPGDDLSQAVADVDYVRVLDNSRAFGFGGAAQTPPSGASVVTHVWNDLDGNGRQDGGEPALANWTVTAINSANNQELRRQQTDVTGDVVLSGLPSAGYRICAEMPAGWHNTRPAVTTTGQACYWISAMSGQSILLSFGQHFNGAVVAAPTPNPTPAQTALDGTVMLSVDARPESGQDFLLTTDLPVGPVIMDSPHDGDATPSYRQVRTRPGIYRIAPNLPAGWTLASGQCGITKMKPGATEVFFTLDAGQTVDCAFVFERVSNIWARAWNDGNGNGRLDTAEDLLPDRRVRIYRDDVYTDQRRTDSGGLADFTQLHSGAYRICIERDLGWTNTLPRIFDADGLACYWTGVPPGVDVAIYFGEKTGLQSPNAAPLVVIDIQPQPQVETPVTPPVPEPAPVRLRVYLPAIVR